MRKINFIFILVLGLFSCNSDDNQSIENAGEINRISGTWNLTKIISNSSGVEITPIASDTHSYVLNDDGTFKRVTLKNELTTELNGTYSVTDMHALFGNENSGIQKFIELTYISEIAFFNCGSLPGNKQLLILTSQNLLENELEGICDGNSYQYMKN
ncbi:DUF5004 domain-containing protein [Aquimarina sp. RZ0]|uniref:DUF5004 domain-containing protein n=1 Tax=Aquimarina sp. RZ0 TaxID=2607730 RepID=UPI0011F1779E|nr:DUF5004 domain-containing protein [Aquimarina sp. RZ0]KAA1243266.1 hypothetical protein F0000_21925 [Aquimarina sp. RZ0]